MQFNSKFKKKFNTWYKKFAWLPKRMTTNPDIVVWLGFYWEAWIVTYVCRYVPLYNSSTDSGTKTYTKEEFERIFLRGYVGTDSNNTYTY